MRIVTAGYVVPWHLANTLQRMPADFEVYVVGQGVSVHQRTYPKVHWIDIDLERKASPLNDLKALFSLCRVMGCIRPDIVHSIMPKAGLLAALAGLMCRVPVRMHTFTGQVWATRRGVSKFFYYWMDRLIASLNTICLTDSPSQSKFLAEQGIKHQGMPLPVLSKGSLSGVDLPRFDRERLGIDASELRRKLGLSETEKVIAFIARKSLDKGALDMLEAYSRCALETHDVRLLFVGPDESVGAVESFFYAHPELIPKILNVGMVDKHETYLAMSDVLCLPSYREGFGSIVIDAAAAGIPTIGTRIPGLVDAIEDRITGVLCPVGDVAALTTAMRDMLADDAKRKQMGQNARLRAQEFFSADVLYAALREQYLLLAAQAHDKGRL